MKILIVDDHEGMRQELQSILARHGHLANAVGSAGEAAPLIESGEYEVVLLDYRMPEHDGLWLMKNVGLPPRTKVLLITAHVDRRVIDEMFRAGAVGYIIKPFDEADLLRHIEFHSGGFQEPRMNIPDKKAM